MLDDHAGIRPDAEVKLVVQRRGRILILDRVVIALPRRLNLVMERPLGGDRSVAPDEGVAVGKLHGHGEAHDLGLCGLDGVGAQPALAAS
jgi:hypothetical protein